MRNTINSIEDRWTKPMKKEKILRIAAKANWNIPNILTNYNNEIDSVKVEMKQSAIDSKWIGMNWLYANIVYNLCNTLCICVFEPVSANWWFFRLLTFHIHVRFIQFYYYRKWNSIVVLHTRKREKNAHTNCLKKKIVLKTKKRFDKTLSKKWFRIEQFLCPVDIKYFGIDKKAFKNTNNKTIK